MLAAAMVLAGGGRAAAQSRDWVVTLLVSPRPSPFVDDYERNPGLATLTTLYTGSTPRDYRIELVARSAQVGEIARVISPTLSLPGGPVTEAYTASEMADWRTESSSAPFMNVVKRSGVVPEGSYQLCARVLDLKGNQLGQGCTNFSILLPEPPRLIAPANLSRLLALQPVLQWTPVIAPPELGVAYRVRVAELLPQQTPTTAIASNRPYYDGTVTGAPMLVYPLDAVPLRGDRTYVWQVTALDANGTPIARRNGQSEIWTFRPSELAALPADRLPDTLDLVPGVARVRGLATAAVTETPVSYTINGTLTLDLLAPTRATVQVTATDLRVDRGSLPTARITSGTLAGDASAALRGALGALPAAITDVAYDARGGLSFGVAAALPGGAPVPLSGRVTATAAGWYGDLAARAGAGSSLGSIGGEPVRLAVQSLHVALPARDLDVQGSLLLAGAAAPCGRVTLSARSGGAPAASISCQGADTLRITPGGEASLAVSALSGTLALDARRGLVPDLRATGELRVAPPGAAPCGATMDLAIDATSATASNARAYCLTSGPGGAADFGWLSLTLSHVALDHLTYRRGAGFDFAASFDAAASVPSLGLALPPLDGVQVTTRGLAFPAVDAPITGGTATVGPVGVSLTHLRASPVTVSWRDWQARSPGGFHFALAGSARVTGLAGATPACLTTATLAADTISLGDGQLRVVAGGAFQPACVVPLAGGAALELSGLHGAAALKLAPTPSVTALPSIDAALLLSSYFACATAPADARRVALTSALQLDASGGVTGRISGLAPPCPIDLSIAQLTLSSATLTLDDAGGVESAVLDGSATASFTADGQSPVKGTGSARVDVLTGRWLGGSLTFAGPLRLDLPHTPALLSFQVPSLTLDSTGLSVDGRGQLLLPQGGQIAATFDRLTLNPQALGVTSGKVLFDTPFALEAGITSTGLAWRVAARGDALGVSDGVRLDLPSQVALGPGGLTATGDAGAEVVWQGKTLDSLGASMSQDFAFDVQQQGVANGSVHLAERGTEVAYVDHGGFHPELGALAAAVVPDSVPLPSFATAYVRLRDATGALLVRADTLKTGGVRLYTATGATVPFVFPVLANGGRAPTLNVAMDVTLDPGGTQVVGGSVRATVAPGTQGFDLTDRGVPLVIDTVAFDNAAGPYQLTVGGGIQLLGQRVDARPRAALLTIDAGGRLRGSVNLTSTQRLPLVGTSQRLAYALRSVNGTFDVALGGGAQTFAWDVDGGFDLDLGGGQHYTVDATLHATDAGVDVTKVQASGSSGSSAPTLDAGAVRLALSNLRVNRLAYARATGVDFELMFDAALTVPALNGLTIPVSDVALRRDGFTIPAIEVPDITAAMLPQNQTSLGAAGFALTPLAFRMAQTTYDWLNNSVPSWGFGADLQVSLAKLPSDAPAGLRGLSATILNAGVTNGRLTGTIQARTLDTPIALPLFQITGLGGRIAVPVGGSGGGSSTGGTTTTGDTAVVVHVAGRAVLPALLRCSSGSDGVAAATPDSLAIGSDGSLSGTLHGLAPQCPAVWGPLAFTVTRGDLTFAASVANGATSAQLQSAGTLVVHGVDGSANATATGSIGIDLLAGRVTNGSIAVAQPFSWTPFTGNGSGPRPTFTVQSAKLDAAGFHLTSTGGLQLEGGGSVAVTFNDLTLGLPSMTVSLGSATIANGFTLGVDVDGTGGLAWHALPTGAPLPSGSSGGGIRITAPQTITMDANGLALAGTGTASLHFGDSTYASLSSTFASGFAIGFSPLSVARGRATFALNGDTIAYVDSLGFTPGNVFALVPLPDSIPLPAFGVAYVKLKDGNGQSVIDVGPDASGGTMHVQTKQGKAAQLIVPALAGTGVAPAMSVGFDIHVDRVTHALKSGSIVDSSGTSGQALFSLASLGVPLDVYRVSYANRGSGSYDFRVDSALLTLPQSIGAADVYVTNLAVTPNGLAGTVDVGSVATPYDASRAAAGFKEVPVLSGGDKLTLQVTGVHVSFGDRSAGTKDSVSIAALARSNLFSADGSTVQPLYVLGGYRAGTWSLAVDRASSAAVLPLGPATFTPLDMPNLPAFSVTADASDFEVTLNGTLAAPKISTDFAVTVDSLRVGTKGVSIKDASISAANAQKLTLWGLPVQLQDSVANSAVVYKALKFARDASTHVLTLEMSGWVTLIDQHPTRFVGLQMGTDGNVSVAQTNNLLPQDVVIAQNTLAIDTVMVDRGNLKVGLWAKLPAPFDTKRQNADFEIAPDGTISGAAKVAVYDDAGAFGSTKQDGTFPLGSFGTIVLRHVELDVDLAKLKQNSKLLANADIYAANKGDQVVNVGWIDNAGQTPVDMPGITVGFDGSVAFANIRTLNDLHLPFGPLDFGIKANSVAVPSDPRQFAVSLTGALKLELPSADDDAGLTLSNVVVTSAGKLDVSNMQFDGGSFSLANHTVSLAVAKFSYQPDGGTLTLPSGTMPGGGGDGTDQGSISTKSYVVFGDMTAASSSGSGSGSNGASGTPSSALRIDAKGISGGVSAFVFYEKQGGGFGLFVQQLHIGVQGVIDASGDIAVHDDATSLGMLLSAKGQILGPTGPGITLVGAYEHSATVTRAGFFVAASVDLPLTPATPVATITSLGGGFFWNPRPEWLHVVAQAANVTDDDVASNVQATAGSGPNDDNPKFAIELYGAFAAGPVPSASPTSGQVLLTVTDLYARVQGKVTFLQQTDKIYGTLDATASWHRGALQGQIHVNAQYAPVLTGSGWLQFYAFSSPTPGSAAWGVTGSLQGSIASILSLDGTLFIGPPGFLVAASMTDGLPSVPFVSLDSVGFQAWYVTGLGFGGTGAVKGGLNLIPGVLGIDAELMGAVIHQNAGPDFIYAAAGVDASAVGHHWTGTVWAEFKDGGFDAGTGADPDLMAAIQAAEDAAQGIDAAQKAAEDAIAAAAKQMPPLVTMSPSQLASAFANLETMSGPAKQMLTAQFTTQDHMCDVGLAQMPPNTICSTRNDGADTYRAWYGDLLQEIGAPTDPTDVTAAASQVSQQLQAIGGERSTVNATIAAIQAKIDDAKLNGPTAPTPASPLSNVSFTPPSTHEAITGKDTVVTDSGGPSFSLNAGAAATQQQSLAQARAAVQAQAAALRTRIVELETVLSSVRASTTPGGQGSLLEFAQRHAKLAQQGEQALALETAYLAARHDWMLGALAALNGKHTAGNLDWVTSQAWLMFRAESTTVHQILNAFYGAPTAMLSSYLQQKSALRQLAYWRLQALDAIAGQGDMADGFTNDMDGIIALIKNPPAGVTSVQLTDSVVGRYRDQADTAGKQLWYWLAYSGMGNAYSRGDSLQAAATAVIVPRIDSVRLAQATLSASLESLYGGQVRLTEALYDIYDRYLTLYADAAVSSSATTGGTASSSAIGGMRYRDIGFTTTHAAQQLLTAYANRRAQLASLLTVPTVTGATVTTQVNGYAASLQFAWTGAHNDGVYAYLLDASRPSGSGAGHSWLDVGPQGSAGTWLAAKSDYDPSFQSTPTTLTYAGSVATGARGGAGYIGYTTVPYTIVLRKPTFRYDYNTSGSGPALPAPPAPPAPTVAQATTDNTPPSTPVVGFQAAGRNLQLHVPTLWISDTSNVHPTWQASDAESGIAEFRYRVRLMPAPAAAAQAGTPVGGGSQPALQMPQVQPIYATVQGSQTSQQGASIDAATLNSFTAVGGRTDAAILRTGLTTGDSLFVDVLAKNGSGKWSAVGTSPALRLDVTPPTWRGSGSATDGTGTRVSGTSVQTSTASAITLLSAVAGSPSPTGSPYAAATTLAACPVATLAASTAAPVPNGGSGGSLMQSGTYGQAGPVWSVPVANPLSSAPAGIAATLSPAPTVSFRRPDAVDPESGVSTYYWRIDTTPASRYVDGDPSWIRPAESFYQPPTLKVVGGKLDYYHQFYISVVAVNAAGLASKPVSYGPFTPLDATNPTAPTLCGSLTPAGANAARFSAAFAASAADSQSGIVGYQYAVVRGGLGTTSVLRAWPTGSAVDWTAAQARPGAVLATASVPGLTDGSSAYLLVRAVNGQGGIGPAVRTGPMVFDQSPPPAPTSLAASYVAIGPKLQFTVNAPNDPNMDFLRLEMAVGTATGKADVIPWEPVAGGAPGIGSYTRALQGTLVGLSATYVLQLRTVNQAGLAGPATSTTFTTPAGPTATIGGVAKAQTTTQATSSCTVAMHEANKC